MGKGVSQMMTFAIMGGRGGQGKSDILKLLWGRGDNWIREGHLYACLLVNQNIPLLKSYETDGQLVDGVE